MSTAEIKQDFFFGGSDNIRVVWDYCILSKLEVEKALRNWMNAMLYSWNFPKIVQLL